MYYCIFSPTEANNIAKARKNDKNRSSLGQIRLKLVWWMQDSVILQFYIIPVSQVVTDSRPGRDYQLTYECDCCGLFSASGTCCQPLDACYFRTSECGPIDSPPLPILSPPPPVSDLPHVATAKHTPHEVNDSACNCFVRATTCQYHPHSRSGHCRASWRSSHQGFVVLLYRPSAPHCSAQADIYARM